MISLQPLPRRIAYVVSFEILAILLATSLLAAMSGGGAHGSLPVAVAASTAAIAWNFIYNTLFEAWERRRGLAARTLAVRILHTLGFEGGLLLILVPLFMWWFSVGPLTALAMEAALLVFFLAFTFAFTWMFDALVGRSEPAQA